MSEAPPPSSANPSGIEELEQVKSRLENELRSTQMQMSDTLKLNDDLLLELKQKNELLLKRESYLSILSEKNDADLNQWETENNCVVERYGYDTNYAKAQLNRLELQRERYLRLRNENDRLRETFEQLGNIRQESGIEHANRIHEMNKEMGMVRENLETKLRKELTAMDARYQNEAFRNLDERFKQDIFENAKLKDEVTLQSIGIANLSLRLDKQKHATRNNLSEINVLNRNGEQLRNDLSDLQVKKNYLNQTISKHTNEIHQLYEKKDALSKAVGPSDLENLQKEIDEYREKIAFETLDTEKWQHRLDLIFKMHDYLIPTSGKEKDGFYLTQNFSIDTTKSEVTSTEVPKQTLMETAASALAVDELRISDVLDAMERDKAFAKAVQILRGKESVLAGGAAKTKDANVEEDCQNMVAWVVNELMVVWKSTESDFRDKIAATNISDMSVPCDNSSPLKHVSIESKSDDNTTPDVGKEQDIDDVQHPSEGKKGTEEREEEEKVFEEVKQMDSAQSVKMQDDENDDENLDQEDIDELWDDVILADQHLESDAMESTTTSWYALLDGAKRLPPDIETGKKNNDEKFKHDAIRPAKISTDFGPPAITKQDSADDLSLDQPEIKNMRRAVSTGTMKAFQTTASSLKTSKGNRSSTNTLQKRTNSLVSSGGVPMCNPVRTQKSDSAMQLGAHEALKLELKRKLIRKSTGAL